jgi:hypothetical protein
MDEMKNKIVVLAALAGLALGLSVTNTVNTILIQRNLQNQLNTMQVTIWKLERK